MDHLYQIALGISGQFRVLLPASDESVHVRLLVLAKARHQLGSRQGIEQLARRALQLILDRGRPLVAGR